MRRNYLNIGLRIAGTVLIILLLAWLSISLYIRYNSATVLKNVTTQLNDRLIGKLSIENMEPELIRGFPGISVSLKNVHLRDSLWSRHQHDLLNAHSIYLSLDPLSLLKGGVNIKKITVENGSLFGFTDSAGYTNLNIFKSRKGAADRTADKITASRIEFRDVLLTYRHALKNKYFRLRISYFQGIVDFNSDGWKSKVDLKAIVEQLQFNTRKGSFLKNNSLEIRNLSLDFNSETRKLAVIPQKIKVQGYDFTIGGIFMFAPGNSAFVVNLKAYNILFKDASVMLLPRITARLQTYDLKKPITAEAAIRGELKNAVKKPLVQVKWAVKNNTLTAGDEVIKNCSFTGVYTNEEITGKERDDYNSAVIFSNLTGKWYNIGFQAPKIKIGNLKRPVIEGEFRSRFPLRKLNAVSGGKSFFFADGMATMNLVYKAAIFKGAGTRPGSILGTVAITGGAATYTPRNLKFRDISLLLNFKGHDLFVQNMKVNSTHTQLAMEGSLRNFLNFYYTDPEKIILDWKITSPKINLSEYMAFLGRRNQPVAASKNLLARKEGPAAVFQQLDRVLDEADAHLLLKVKELIYKKFTASNVTSDITMKQKGIEIKQVSLNHAGGSLNVTGYIDQSGSFNKITTQARIINVDVKQLFSSFENFGQDAITDKNLRGVFFGSTTMSATMKNTGEMVPRSFFGTVNFDLRNGALVNFEPMEKIGRFTFPNRNFSNITFRNLKNTLEFRGEKVYIPPMLIESSVFNVFLSGVYSFTTGTNIALEVPLRNPQQDAYLPDSVKESRRRRGIVLNLSAVDGLDGNVKIKLGKKTGKNR